MSILRTHFDRSYFENAAHKESLNSQRNRNRLRELFGHKREGKLLEVGCGKGGFLRLAAERFDVRGIDISSYAVGAIKHVFGDRVRTADVEKKALPSAYYDVVAAFNVLEHLRGPRKVVRKIYDSLTDDGILIGSVPNNCALVGRVATALMNLFDRTHRSTYPTARWRALFQEVGFREVHLFGEITLGRNASLFVKHRPWRYVSFNLMFLCRK